MSETAAMVLPRGRLEWGARARARVPAEGALARRLGEQAAALARLDSRLLAPARTETAAGEVIFELATERPGTLAADQAFALHFRDPLAQPVLLSGLLAFLLGLWRDVESIGLGEAVWGLGPATLRFTPGRPDPWRVLAVPQPALAAADWARADERVWSWAAPEVVLGGVVDEAALAWTLGAALAHALGADAAAARLPAHERFRRAIAGRGARPALLASALRAALPPSFEDERAEVVAAIAQLMNPDAAERPRGEALRELAGALYGRIHAHRVAARWAWHGQTDAARAVIDAQTRSFPASEVPWSLLARLDEEAGQYEAALAAARRGLDEDEQGDGEREYVGLIARLCGRAPARLLSDALGALAEHRLDDVTRVFLAHLEARWLEQPAAAQARLRARLETPWGEVLAAVVGARIAAEAADWVAVSKACKQARAELQAPGVAGGGEPGRYLAAYLDLLDGIANHGAVALLGDASYLVDAFEALSRALAAAREVRADDLVEACAAWLAVLARDAGRHGGRYATLALGARALAPAGAGRALLPWYDETRLFPRAGRRGGA